MIQRNIGDRNSLSSSLSAERIQDVVRPNLPTLLSGRQSSSTEAKLFCNPEAHGYLVSGESRVKMNFDP